MLRLVMNKKTELEFLKKLADYFENVPKEDIKQNKGRMAGKDDNCGCFGAHIAKMEALDVGGDEYYYDYEDGLTLFLEMVSFETLDYFIIYGAKDDEYGTLFCGEDWDEHPHTVLKKVIGELEK